MKRLRKIIFRLFLILIIVISGALIYITYFLPDVGPAPILTIKATPERIERGRYLAHHVAVCIDCHSTRDWSRYSGPPMEGTYGKGGDLFDQKFGFPGKYYARNITPAGISRYTDGELFRVITTGVNKEGKAMFPVMPFHYYGQLDPEDIYSIIAYIRTLPSIDNKIPESESDFPVNFLINTMPHKGTPMKLPKPANQVAYGKYLSTAGGCIECHTQFKDGSLIPGTEWGGGREFPFPNGSKVVSSNLTPDKETGIGHWQETDFIRTFRGFSDSAVLKNKLPAGAPNTIMPWTMYGGMTDQDLKAIFAYLKTVKPIKNKVDKFK